jgi:PAS domain S-box-containing protein
MNITILIVDDSRIDRTRYINFLTSDNSYQSIEASTLEKAKELCKEIKPQIILLGFPLTDGSGLEFLNWIKQQEQIASLPILLLVKQAEESIAAQTTKSGIQDYLVKDFLTHERLMRSLDHLLERSQLVNTSYDSLNLQKFSEQLILESKENFCLLIECSDGLIWSIDLEGKFTYLSPQFRELFGWEHTEWIGEKIIDLVHVDDLQRFQNSIEKTLKSNKKGDLAVEFRHRQKDGSYVWMSCNMTPRLNSLGTAVSVLGISRDISDRIALADAIRNRKQAESKLKESNEILSVVNQELLKAIKLKDEFLSTISHELRTPLNAILGLTEILQEPIYGYGSLNEEQIQALTIIESSGDHLLDLINNILDFSKIEVGDLELQRTSTSIARLCQASLDFVKYQALSKNIQLRLNINDNLPEIFLDERRMRQALIHLLNNAIKFTPQSGQIALTANALNKSWVQIAVWDTGIGIAPESLHKLFLPFVQLDGNLNRRYQGTGLGLAIVKQIIESHGGKVSVNSKVEVGSCFTIELPVLIAI